MNGFDFFAVLLDRLSGVLPTLLTMTLSASVAALVVMVLHLVLRKVPRRYLMILWLFVLVRMLSPYGYGEGFVSLIPEAVSSGRAAEVILEAGGADSLSPAEPAYQTADLPANGDGALAGPMPAAEAADSGVEKHAPPPITPGKLIPVIWLAGTAGMLLWSLTAYVRVRRQVADAVRTESGDVWEAYETDAIDTPFVLGTNIYLPVGLAEEDRKYVLLHEQAHAERYDAALKAVAWIALSLHWFNPVLWLAYRLLCRDVEAACDQRVIDGFDPATRREDTAGYAAALYHLGRRERVPQAVLPFGEENAKGRIKAVLAYQKPAKWVAVLVVALCAAVGMLIAFNGPAREETTEVEFAGTTIQFADAYETLFTVTDGSPGQRAFTLPFALTEEMVTVLEGAECRTYHDQESIEQDPALAGWDGREENLMGDIRVVQCFETSGENAVLYGWGNGTVLWADSDHDTYLLYPDVKDSEAFQTWAAHVDQCMTTDWAGEMYDLSLEGTSLRQIDRSPRGVLFYTGIRQLYPTSSEAVITQEDRILTVRIQEGAPYTDPAIFEQVFDQYLREASLRTIALVDTIDEIDYIYPTGIPGPSVTLILEDKPSREEFIDWYVNGFDGVGVTSSAGDGQLQLDGKTIDDVTLPVYRYGRGSQNVILPEDLTREFLSVLRAHPHEDYRPVSEEDRLADHSDLLRLAGASDMAILTSKEGSVGLYVFSDGLGVLSDGRAQQVALIPGLGTAADFLAWQDRARTWLTEDWPHEIFAQCTDPAMNNWPQEDRLRVVLAHLGFDLVLDMETPVDSWSGGTLRLNLAQLDLENDSEAAAELVRTYLASASRLLQTVLKDVDDVDRVVYITKDGVELEVDLTNSSPLDEDGFVALFNDRSPAAGPPFKVISGIYTPPDGADRQSQAAQTSAAARPAQTTTPRTQTARTAASSSAPAVSGGTVTGQTQGEPPSPHLQDVTELPVSEAFPQEGTDRTAMPESLDLTFPPPEGET